VPPLRSPLWIGGDPRVKPLRGTAELDPQHPLARGLVGCWIDAEDLIVEDLSPRANTATGVNGPPVVPGSSGLAFSFNGSSQRLLTQRSKSVDLIGPLTVAQRVQPRGSFVNYRNTIARGDNINGQLGILVDSTGLWSSESGTIGAFNGTVLVLGKDADIAYTLDANAGGVTRTYTDGVLITTVTEGTTPSKDQDLTIGADTFNGRWWSGLIYYTYLWNRALTSGEIAWLHAEPYAMLRPAGVRRHALSLPVSRNALIPAEWFGGIRRNAPVPVEWRGRLFSRSVPVEWFGGLARAAPIPVEWRGRVFARSVPLEWAGLGAGLLEVYWNVQQNLNALLPLLWSVVSAVLAAGVQVQWNVVGTIAQQLPIAWNVIPDVVTPFSQDVQQPAAITDKTP
jgi:hypothetical protein